MTKSTLRIRLADAKVEVATSKLGKERLPTAIFGISLYGEEQRRLDRQHCWAEIQDS